MLSCNELYSYSIPRTIVQKTSMHLVTKKVTSSEYSWFTKTLKQPEKSIQNVLLTHYLKLFCTGNLLKKGTNFALFSEGDSPSSLPSLFPFKLKSF